MAKHSETFEHTADIGIAAWGDTIGELYEALGEGLADFICARDIVTASQARRLAVQAEDAEALAVDFLSTLLNMIQTDHFMISKVRALRADEHELTVEAMGEPYDAARHEIHTEVKAITYHMLKVANEQGRWVGRVILDL